MIKQTSYIYGPHCSPVVVSLDRFSRRLLCCIFLSCIDGFIHFGASVRLWVFFTFLEWPSFCFRNFAIKFRFRYTFLQKRFQINVSFGH